MTIKLEKKIVGYGVVKEEEEAKDVEAQAYVEGLRDEWYDRR